MIMKKILSLRCPLLPGFSFLALMLVFVLAACGSNAGGTGTTTGGASSNPTPVPTTIKGYGTTHGCPSDLVVNNASAKASVTVDPKQSNSVISAHNGDTIEVRLPFGRKWSGPTSSQGVLELQNPSGYALAADNVCVWRFLAKGTGKTQLDFLGAAICKPGAMCSMAMMDLPFTIDVK